MKIQFAISLVILATSVSAFAASSPAAEYCSINDAKMEEVSGCYVGTVPVKGNQSLSEAKISECALSSKPLPSLPRVKITKVSETEIQAQTFTAAMKLDATHIFNADETGRFSLLNDRWDLEDGTHVTCAEVYFFPNDYPELK